MIQQDEQTTYESSTLPYYERPYLYTGVIDAPSHVTAPLAQSIGQPPEIPDKPTNNTSPHGRHRRTGAILLLTLFLIIVLSVGLFAGWTFAKTSSTSTATTTTVTTASTSSRCCQYRVQHRR